MGGNCPAVASLVNIEAGLGQPGMATLNLGSSSPQCWIKRVMTPAARAARAGQWASPRMLRASSITDSGAQPSA